MADSRLHALKQLKLKTVIKESHCSPVQHLDFNLCDADCRNLFATVAKDQATIYDDMHMGDHVAVVENLSLSNSLDGPKDVFHACCWVKSAGLSQHPYGDVLLAVGGSDPCIHIISVVQAAVVGQLPLPAGAAVAELSAASECPGLLLVLSRDGTLQLWQISSGACLWSCKTDAFAAAIHPDGSCVLTSSRAGKLSLWDTSGLDISPAAVRSSAGAEVAREAWLTAEHPDSAVDCIRFLTGDLVCLKTADGHMSVHSWPSGKLASSWKVPGCGSSSTPSYSKRCSFGHTRDGRFVCVGNHMATAYVYDTRTGRQVTRVEAIRVQGCVKGCGLSEDCRHLVMVVGHGYLFRFETKASLLDKGSEEEQDGNDDEAAASGSDTEMAEAGDAAAAGAEGSAAEQGQPQQLQQQGPPLPQQQQGQQQQQQAAVDQQPLARPSDPTVTPAALAQQRQGQQQYSPGWFGSLADMAAPNSTGSLGGLMALGSTPQDQLLTDPTMQQQLQLQQQEEEEGVMGLSAGPGGVQAKRQRLAGGEGDDSPLVFRPTPCKQ